ncbi:DUF6398 domain-containing protein [Romboutsia sp.]|uniref:DUF6398 domain-containing protein n=1 Tax=Romboutsia sp. TaxID=1965302 RepID=UPI003F379F6C
MSNKAILKEIKYLVNQLCEMYFSKDIEKQTNTLIKYVNKNKDFSVEKGKIEGWAVGFIYVVCEDSGLFDGCIKNSEGQFIDISRAEFSRMIQISTSTIKSREKYIRSFLNEKNNFSVQKVQNLECMYDFEENDEFDFDINETLKKNLLEFLENQCDDNFEDETENERNIRINMEKAEEAQHIDDAIKYTKKAMDYARQDIPDFDEIKGEFWVFRHTRPYMMVKDSLADLYFYNGRIQEGVKEYKELLELNKMDNQGIRYKLINACILTEDKECIEYLHNEYPEETPHMLYPLALYSFYKKDQVNAKRYMEKAMESNKHVGEILFGFIDFSENKFAYALGSEEEASAYLDCGGDMWLAVDGALQWLYNEYINHLKKHNIDLGFTKKEKQEIEKHLISINNHFRKQCPDMYKLC